MATREEYSSAATPISVGRGLICFLAFVQAAQAKGRKNAVGDHTLRDQKIPAVTEALPPPLTSVSSSFSPSPFLPPRCHSTAQVVALVAVRHSHRRLDGVLLENRVMRERG